MKVTAQLGDVVSDAEVWEEEPWFSGSGSELGTSQLNEVSRLPSYETCSGVPIGEREPPVRERGPSAVGVEKIVGVHMHTAFKIVRPQQL